MTALEGDSSPNDGDITVCLYCGHIMAFTNGLTVRPLTDQEMVDVAGNEMLLAVQRARSIMSPDLRRQVSNGSMTSTKRFHN